MALTTEITDSTNGTSRKRNRRKDREKGSGSGPERKDRKSEKKLARMMKDFKKTNVSQNDLLLALGFIQWVLVLTRSIRSGILMNLK